MNPAAPAIEASPVAAPGAAPAPLLAPARPEAPAPTLCVLLAGGLKLSPLMEALGCSVLDTLLTPERTVLQLWLDHLAAVASADAPLDVRVVHGEAFPPPCSGFAPDGVSLRVEREPRQYRGPAGVASDIARSHSGAGPVLVVESARYLGADLAPLFRAHADRKADVTVAANPDNSPAGLYVIRPSALELVPDVGFMDLKEQWLGKAIAAGRTLRVHRLADPGCCPLRTRRQVLDAARAAMGVPPRPLRTLRPADAAPGGEPFRVIGRGVKIGSDAIVEDAVIMDGVTIGDGAVVVRSIVCKDATIASGASVVDAVVGPRGVHADPAADPGHEAAQP